MTEPRKPGRPRGKRSSEDYIQISAYIKRTTYRAVKIRCFELDKELSEVVEEMLQEWLLRTQKDDSANH